MQIIIRLIRDGLVENKNFAVERSAKREGFADDRMLVNVVMNFFGSGEVRISPRGSLYIGKIIMQRKGGTPDPTKIQFKIKPCELFNLGK